VLRVPIWSLLALGQDRAYTQFDRVELPNGDELVAQTFLDEVQKEVLGNRFD